MYFRNTARAETVKTLVGGAGKSAGILSNSHDVTCQQTRTSIAAADAADKTASCLLILMLLKQTSVIEQQQTNPTPGLLPFPSLLSPPLPAVGDKDRPETSATTAVTTSHTTINTSFCYSTDGAA